MFSHCTKLRYKLSVLCTVTPLHDLEYCRSELGNKAICKSLLAAFRALIGNALHYWSPCDISSLDMSVTDGEPLYLDLHMHKY